LSKKVADAEILWAFKCVYSHFSGNSNVGENDLFKRLFSDSEIAANFSMSDSKFSRAITFGLCPHFARKLSYDVKQSPAHALLFDESLNEELHSKHLHMYVHCWSSENSKVESQYLMSLFIGHSRTRYEEATKDLYPAKTWNIVRMAQM